MTLDFTTAKALRDCGYPQVGCEKAYYLNGGENTNAVIDAEMYANVSQSFWEEKLVAIPNLSELIQELELCDITDFSLNKEWGNKWRAKMFIDVDLGVSFKAEGTTPELACANLYLSIHKK